MSTDYFQRQITNRQRFMASRLKVRGAFLTVYCKHKTLADALPMEERVPHETVMNQLNDVLRKMDTASWPTIYLSDILNKESMDYESCVDAFKGLDIKTFLKFCSVPLIEIKVYFRSLNLDLPEYMEELHVAYRNGQSGQAKSGTRNRT